MCAQGQSEPEVNRILVCSLSFKSYLCVWVTEKPIQDILEVEYTSFCPEKLKREFCQTDSYNIALDKEETEARNKKL